MQCSCTCSPSVWASLRRGLLEFNRIVLPRFALTPRSAEIFRKYEYLSTNRTEKSTRIFNFDKKTKPFHHIDMTLVPNRSLLCQLHLARSEASKKLLIVVASSWQRDLHHDWQSYLINALACRERSNLI